MIAGDIEDISNYLSCNDDHYEFQLELVDGIPTFIPWLETRYTNKHINEKLTNLLEALKI